MASFGIARFIQEKGSLAPLGLAPRMRDERPRDEGGDHEEARSMKASSTYVFKESALRSEHALRPSGPLPHPCPPCSSPTRSTSPRSRPAASSPPRAASP